MINDPLWIIILILLLINTVLIGIGDLILAFMAGMRMRKPKKKKRKRNESDEGLGVEVFPDSPGSGSIRVPEHKLPEFFNSLVRARATMPHSPHSVEEKKENEKVTPAGYI